MAESSSLDDLDLFQPDKGVVEKTGQEISREAGKELVARLIAVVKRYDVARAALTAAEGKDSSASSKDLETLKLTVATAWSEVNDLLERTRESWKSLRH